MAPTMIPEQNIINEQKFCHLPQYLRPSKIHATSLLITEKIACSEIK
jgi:hypothetical protein